LGCARDTHDKEAGKITPASDVIALSCSCRFLRGSTRKVNAHAQCLLQRRLTEVCMHHENRHRVSVGICEGHTHPKEAGKVTPASDVIALPFRYRFLRGSTR